MLKITASIHNNLWLLLAGSLFLPACQPVQQNSQPVTPKAFTEHDECHVCGMSVTRFPGPKGQVLNANGQAAKFCSSAEMFGWYLQPEHQRQQLHLFVHDMGSTDWDKPADSALIDARTAYYVVAEGYQSAMGMPIASFADKAKAEQFAATANTVVLRFTDIDQQLLQSGVIRHHHHH
ncbi:nitrous oxide reductase accessory protein NosL [Chromatiaceae bacterium AAb-1]|nr:nitrous oxide reductase accessory protein NosL [Chromatiaceae bacterium AAb-1]